ncbi:MAG TPA: WG repeat-containing protein, partial [Cyclobacteriaceae bacterium]|nr:WG repeat-containing protein [Cyclobacteriaceae bacterium]
KAESYFTFEERGKIGLKNETGLIIIPAKYEALGWSNGSFSIAGQVTGYKLHGSWGVVSLSNQRITGPDYSSLTPADGMLLVASKRSASFKISTGCISTDGKVVIPFTYTGVTVHSLRAVAFIREGNLFKHGLIDLENKILIPFLYRNIYPIGSLRYAVENFDGKTALYSEGGKQITGFTIDSISHFKNNVAIIYEAGRQGLITREGELKSEAKYRDIRIDQNAVSVRMPDEWRVLDAQNKQTEIIGADSVVSLGEGRYKIEDAQSVRLVNGDFKSVNPEVFLSVSPFQHRLSIIKSKNQYGVIKKNGEIILRPVFQKIILADDYILAFEKNVDKSSWSLRDTLGNKRNSKTYDLINPKQHVIFPVIKNGYWGAIDERGFEIVACVYDSILEANDNQLAVKFRGQYGIISLKEEWLAFPQKHQVKLLNQDRYFMKRDGALFLYSFNGTILYFTINPIQVEKDHFLESVSNGGTWTIDFDGRIINRQLPPAEPTEAIFPSTEGLRGIRKNGKFGFIDDLGRLRIANRYEDIKPFSEGLAAFKIRNKWGFLSRDENIMIQPAYEDVTPFYKGYSIIKQKGLYGLLTHEGKVVLPARYNSVAMQENGRFLISVNGLQGLADQHGNVLLHPKYNSITDLDNGYVIIEQDGKFGLVTLTGLSTIPLIYDYLKYDAEKNRYLALKKSQWVTLQ